MQGPRQCYKFIKENRSNFKLLSVQKICIILGVSESGYYRYLNNPVNKREERNYNIKKEIINIFDESRKTAGTLTIYNDLREEKGLNVSKKKIREIKRQNNIYPKSYKKFKATTNSNHGLPVAENILNREFEQGKYGNACVSDITYIPTDEGWIYLAIIKELASKKIIGFSMSERMTKELVIRAGKMAINSGNLNKHCIFHSDRGSQYCSYAYQALLRKHDLMSSMSRKGNCWDNAPAESFFATLKKDLVYHEHYKTREEAEKSIFEYILVFYNQKRKNSTLGYTTPSEYAKILLAG